MYADLKRFQGGQEIRQTSGEKLFEPCVCTMWKWPLLPMGNRRYHIFTSHDRNMKVELYIVKLFK